MRHKTQLPISSLVPTKLDKVETMIETFFLTNNQNLDRNGKMSYDAKQVYYLCLSIVKILKGLE
jgi:hypothetical protein